MELFSKFSPNVVNLQQDCDAKDVEAIVIDSRFLTKASDKFLFFFVRKWFIDWVKKPLSKRYGNVKALALYPNYIEPKIFYSLDTFSTQYAERNLLPVEKKKTKKAVKWLWSLFNDLHPAVESFAICREDIILDFDVIKARGYQFDSFIQIYTSNPVTLLFNNPKFPYLVAHQVPLEKAQAEFAKKQRLYELFEGIIPKPIEVIELPQTSILLEQGLDAMPWFNLAAQGPAFYLAAKQKAKQALFTFSERVSAEQDWCKSVILKQALTDQFAEILPIKALPQKTVTFINKLIELNEPWMNQPLNSHFQHGDFCINNLMFSDHIAFIIDLEDFGRNVMPFQDDISLAISFCAFEGQTSFDHLLEQLTFIGNKALMERGNSFILALYVFQLLYKLGHWGNQRNRQNHCKEIEQLLNGLVDPAVTISPSQCLRPTWR